MLPTCQSRNRGFSSEVTGAHLNRQSLSLKTVPRVCVMPGCGGVLPELTRWRLAKTRGCCVPPIKKGGRKRAVSPQCEVRLKMATAEPA